MSGNKVAKIEAAILRVAAPSDRREILFAAISVVDSDAEVILREVKEILIMLGDME